MDTYDEIGRPIPRTEALRIAREILEKAEEERLLEEEMVYYKENKPKEETMEKKKQCYCDICFKPTRCKRVYFEECIRTFLRRKEAYQLITTA